MTDQYVVRDWASEAARWKEQEKKTKAAERRKKGKDARTNYQDIDSVEYSTMRQGDWFRKPRDENLHSSKLGAEGRKERQQKHTPHSLPTKE